VILATLTPAVEVVLPLMVVDGCNTPLSTPLLPLLVSVRVELQREDQHIQSQSLSWTTGFGNPLIVHVCLVIVQVALNKLNVDGVKTMIILKNIAEQELLLDLPIHIVNLGIG